MMRKVTISIIAIAALSGTIGGVARLEAGDIRIWPTAQVNADVVTLADVAELRGFAPELHAHLAAVIVHGSPRPGQQILLRTADVREALLEAAAPLGDIRLFGSSRCRVSRERPPALKPAPRARKTGGAAPQPPAHKPVRTPPRLGDGEPAAPQHSLEAWLRDYISARVGVKNSRVDIRFSPTCRRFLDLGGKDARFVVRPQETRPLGLQSFEVRIERPGQPPRDVLISADVQLAKQVVVARKPINQGQPITGRDLRLEERLFSDMADIGLEDLSAAVGLESRRFIRPGDMLTARLVVERPLVRRGDHIRILIQANGLQITTSGQAQSDGVLGQTIAVRRDGAKRKQDVIDAVVAGPALVTYGGTQAVAARE